MAKLRTSLNNKFILFFTAAGIIVLIWAVLLQAAFNLQEERKTGNRKELIQDANRAQVLLQEVLFKEYELALSDLSFIALRISKLGYFKDYNHLEKKEAEQFVRDLGVVRGTYYQIRILDTNGYERSKIQFEDSQVLVNEDNQNKHNRGYFQEALKLNTGEIYISKIDLHVEHNEIARPYIPVVRFITPITQTGSSKVIGYVIMNYSGERLLRETKHLEANSALRFYILNKDGYWIQGPNQADNWAFLFPDPNKHHVSITWPTLAHAIEKRNSLNVDHMGLASIAYLNLPEMLIRHGDKLKGDLPEWRVIAIFPISYLNVHLQEETILGWGQTIILGILSTFIIALIFVYLVRKEHKLQLVQSQLKSRNQTLRENELVLQENLAQMEELTQEREKSIDRLQAKERELSIAKKNAENATQAKSDFLATMSHEIRTPLNAVLGMSQLLERTSLTAQQLDLLKTLKLSGESLLGLINEILDFSKIESENLELENQEYFIDQVCEEAIELVSSRANEKAIGISYTVAPEVPFLLYGDVSRLRQILINLLSNAIKFTDKGRVELKVKTHKNELIFEVIDTGIGISKDKLSSVFEAFKQADSSVNRKYGGTGLGLTISKRLASAMGGDLTVSSSLGIGSTFSLNLPLNKPNEQKLVDYVAQVLEPWFYRVDDFVLNNQIQTFTKRFSIASKAIKETEEMDAPGVLLSTHSYILNSPLVSHRIWISNVENSTNTELGQGIIQHSVPFRPLAILRTLSQHSSETADAKPNPSSKNISVLVAEDNPVNQKLIKLVLDQLGIEPQVVSNGLEAVQAIRTRNFDLVLMDIQMPEMDGLEATKHIRKLTGVTQPYIVAVTANAFSNQREEYLNAGMNAHISKPYKISEVETILHEASQQQDTQE